MSASVSRRAAPPAARTWIAGSWTPLLWAGLSAVAYVAAAFGALAVTLPVREILPAADQLSLPVAWTLLAALGVLVAARVCFGAWPRVAVEAWILLTTGAAFAGAVHASLHAWARYRYGYFDVELIGPTALFAFIMIAVAVAGFGVLVAPRRGAALPPLLATLAGIGASVLALGGNLAGLADGIDPESVIPAWTIGMAAGYVVLVGIVAAWSVLRPADPDR